MHMSINSPKNIIIRMPNWLGDAVMATPILQDLKIFWPQSSLQVLCHEGIHNLLQHNPYIDDFLVFSREKKRKSEEKRRVLSLIRERSFDLGILVTRSFSSAWWFFRSGVRSRIGFQDHFRSPLLTTGLAVPANEESEHQVITYKRLLEPLGIAQSLSVPELFVQKEELKAAKELLRQCGISDEHNVIGINPGAAFGSAKCWPEDRFIALTKALEKDPKNRVIYFADPSGKPLVDAICQKCSSNTVNLAAKTNLRTLIALISLSKVFVSNDSGPMHVAAALKTPLVAIFGSTNDVKTGPYGTATVIHKHVACSPCYRRTCPIDFRCMKSISCDDVLNAIYRYLGR